MERLLARLDRRYGRHAPQGVILWVVGLSGLLRLLVFAKPEALSFLLLDPDSVRHGEVWRVVTFLFAPAGPVDGMSLIWTGFGLWLLHTMGSSLEHQWGALRFDLFLLVGGLLTLAAGLLVGAPYSWSMNGDWLATAVLVAFALEFPDFEVLLIILPVKVKWLGLISAAYMVYWFVVGGGGGRLAVGVALGDLLLFCGSDVLARVRGVRADLRSARRASTAQSSFGPAPRKARVCAKCGRSDADDATLEFRVCDCQEKCGGKLTEYCIEHARNH
jgi:hypothetical protein